MTQHILQVLFYFLYVFLMYFFIYLKWFLAASSGHVIKHTWSHEAPKIEITPEQALKHPQCSDLTR